MGETVDRPLSILQVNTTDMSGGAARVALGLHRAYREMGHASTLAVKARKSNEPGVVEIDRSKRGSLLCRIRARLGYHLGVDDLCRPGSHRIPELVGKPWDVLHLHNLHGRYFDLAALPALSRMAPTVMMMHDNWLQTGGCTYHGDCSAWKNACRGCECQLPGGRMARLGARLSWRRKARILRRSRVWLTAPSRWLLNEARELPILAEKPSRLVHNGIDTTVFRPGPKDQARTGLGLPQGVPLILFSANISLANPAKGGPTVAAAFKQLLTKVPDCRLVAVGSDEIPDKLDDVDAKIIARRYEDDMSRVALYYQAADVLAHPARTDNAPLVLMEAMASQLPVVASRVGGIPDYVQDGVSGLLIAPDRPEELAASLVRVLEDKELAAKLGREGLQAARSRYDVRDQARNYLEWYHELLRATGREG